MLSTLSSLTATHSATQAAALAATTAALPQAAPPAPAGEPPRPFAQQLQSAQQQDAAPEPAPAGRGPAARPAAKTASSKAPEHKDRPPAAANANASTGTDRGAACDGTDGATADAASLPTDLAGSDTEETTAAAAATPGASPQDLSTWIAQLRGHQPAAAEVAAGKGLPGEGGTLDEPGRAGRTGRAGREGRTAHEGSDDTGHAAGRSMRAADGAGTTQAATPWGANTGARHPAGGGAGHRDGGNAGAALQHPGAATQDTPLASTFALPEAGSFSATLAAAAGWAPAPGTAAPAAASTAVQAQLPAALGSPDFAPQLGAQINTFVRDGVQHAQLHLNPAEMGPVTVQIQLDGSAAQVHLAADQAQTRQALEQAMPELAGSLREAGLTLTGGGVFQQPRQPGGDANTRDSGAAAGRAGGTALGAAADGADTTSRSTAAPRRRGVVDLVA